MPATTSNSEWLTRRQLVDPKLAASGWKVVLFDASRPLTTYDRCAIVEYPTDKGPADYALCTGGRILGIIEAKKLSLGPQNVLTQAERYSKGATANPLSFGAFRVPFLYSTNGELIWHHDVRHPNNRSRKVVAFPSPSALEELLVRDFEGALSTLGALKNDHPRLRPYQVECNAAVEAAIAERRRKLLVAMATGTGKTFTLVNQIYRLMKAGVAKRILFLVDRRALAAQAVRAFTAFEPESGHKFDQIYEFYSQRFQTGDFGDEEKFDPKVLPNTYLTNPGPGHAFVYVSTIQRMTINLFGKEVVIGLGDPEVEDDADRLDIPAHAFDLIVADECHRGYTANELNIWRDTLDYFDAIKVGLTATPAAHTLAYFENVAYRYEYERAVREGFLVDYDVVAVRSAVRMDGAFLSEGELVGVVDTKSGAEKMDHLEDERTYEAGAIERDITVPDSNRKILEEMKKYALEHEERTGRFPKTLIFAVNDLPHTSHADQLVQMARDVFGRGESFVTKITGKVDRPLQRIREFRNRPEPGIVVTVDLLSTGVDIPDLEFIVFLRPVKSRILFEQMLGRGTRKGEKFPDKSHFTVFDCFDGTLIRYFREATAITELVPVGPTRSILEIIEDVWQNRDREYNTRCLVKRLQRIDKEMAGEARIDFAVFIPDGDVRQFAESVPGRIADDFTAVMAILRNPSFQKLLIDYRRPDRTFLKGIEVVDQVESVWIVRDAEGKEYKPEDYLVAFSRFVEENRNTIDALQILLDRPSDWGVDALNDLRNRLAAASPLRFEEEKLRIAHEKALHKSMADIISMVRHAARNEEGLFTAEERVARAMMRITGGIDFTPEQMEWLQRIRVHLVKNLSIGRDDFDCIPVFSSAGGWGRADRVFGGTLPQLILRFNEAVATAS